MKKILLTLLLLITFIPGVNADTTVDIIPQDYQSLVSLGNSTCSNGAHNYYIYSDFHTFISDSNNKEIFDNLYNEIKSTYINNYSQDYPYYIMSVNILSSTSNKLTLHTVSITLQLYESLEDTNPNVLYISYKKGTYYEISNTPSACESDSPFLGKSYSIFKVSGTYKYSPLSLFETTKPRYIPYDDDNGNLILNIYNKSGEIIKTYVSGDEQPVLFENGYDNYQSDIYTQVNLDNYEYVILNLKNYNKTDAFNTNLKVKGMIGITPVYNFGTAEKTEITDRCNISYTEYTDYRLYILKNDLINNAVYYVKSCEENSSFKFDSSIFDITYITTETVNDPVITVGGVEYKTIPFNKLSNSANKNEQNNFIPGEAGSSLTDIIDNVSKFTNDIWDAVSSFMGLVTKFFNTLPPEFRYLSITAFTVLIFIAIIKFLKG